MHAEFNKCVCAEHEQRCMWDKQTESLHPIAAGWVTGTGQVGLGWDEMRREGLG